MGTILKSKSAATQQPGKTPPARVVHFIRNVIRSEKFHEGDERRQTLRYPVTMPIRAVPLDDEGISAGEPFLAVTRDISVGGLCMYHLAPVVSRLLQLELVNSSKQEQLRVVLEVVRCLQTGPLYEIAGRFVDYE
jgi:hypothetical protein